MLGRIHPRYLELLYEPLQRIEEETYVQATYEVLRNNPEIAQRVVDRACKPEIKQKGMS